MGLFPNVNDTYQFGGKTHTGLVVSEGNAPAERFVVAKDNNIRKHADDSVIAPQFTYVFGPEGNQTVLIAKGKVVEAAGVELDRETGHKYTAIRVADEGSTKVIGVNHHNVYEQRRDRIEGNLPTVIRRAYIEVPLFEHGAVATAEAFAKAMHFGAAYGTSNDLQPGDRVKVGKNGNFVKAVIEDVLDVDGTTVLTPADSAHAVVGQVLAVERELPPAGFLQYFVDARTPEMEEMIKAMSHAPRPANGEYPYGYPYTAKGWKPEFEKNMIEGAPMGSDKGIPFLTDGFFRAKKVLTGVAISDIYAADTNNDGVIEAIRPTGDITVTGDQVVAGDKGGALFIKLRHKIDQTEAGNVVVKADGTAVAAKDVHVDYQNNTVVVYMDEAATVTALTLDVKAIVDPVAGIPTEWDHAGSVGAVRIQLLG